MLTLAKIFEPEIWAAGISETVKETNKFILSGVATNTTQLDDLAKAPGRIVDVPFWKSINYEEPDYSNDDETQDSVASDVEQGTQVARKAFLHKSWGAMSLASEIQGLEDPVSYVINNIGSYWNTVVEQRTIASAVGVMNDSIANHTGDMVVNIATDDAGAPTDAELISPEAIINAKLTLGDRLDDVTAIAVHSVVYARLLKLQLIDFQENPVTGGRIPYYLNMMVFVDDSMPITAGTNRVTYTSILYTNGAFGLGVGASDTPLELERKPSAGKGGGADILHSREVYLVHPKGYAFESASVTGASPNIAELQDATNWKRVYDYRKNIPMAFLLTNG